MLASSRSEPRVPSFGPRLLLTAAAVGVGILATVLVQRAWLTDPVPDAAAADSSLVTSKANPAGTDAEQAQFVPLPHRPAGTFVAPPSPPLGGSSGESGSVSDLMLKLDQRFRAEVVNPTWASVHEDAILDAIAGTEHDGFDVPLPQSVDARCRSSMCRIRMTYRDEDDAAQMQTKTMLGMPQVLSTARTFYAQTRSGETEMVIYAGHPGALH